MGFVAAIIAGEAQILVTIIVGNQAKTFTSFGTDLSLEDLSNPDIIQGVIDKFYSFTAKYSLILVGMGKSN
jgi:hypothetical protein